MVEVISGALTIVLVWYVGLPWWGQGLSSTSVEQVAKVEEGLMDQYERCVQVLKDLELDFQTKKISEADYLSMKEQANSELIGVQRQLQTLTNKGAQ